MPTQQLIYAFEATLANFGTLLGVIALIIVAWMIWDKKSDSETFKACPKCGREIQFNRYLTDWDRQGRSYYCIDCLHKF